MFNDSTSVFSFRGPFGVRVEIGSSMIMLVVLIFMLGRGDVTYALTIIGVLIGSIFLHELGHAWGCIVQGVPVRRIMLHGGGGFCEHAVSPSRHQQEFIVAMGPIVNLTIWAVGSLALNNLGLTGYVAWAVGLAVTINFYLAIFNLLPIQPLDGGKLFQLGLMRVLPSIMATRIAGGVGLIFAILWIPMLIYVFMTFGFILFFFPPFRLHLDMLRASR